MILNQKRPWIALPATAVMFLAARAAAQCVAHDFEDQPVGSVVTAGYDGVVFSAVGDSCDDDPPLYMRIADEFYGDVFSSQVLLIDGGCPDFSPDFLRMVFLKWHHNVRFTIGLWGSPYTYTVRVYATATGGAPVEVHSVSLPGDGFAGALHQVTIERTEGDIRRIEIECSDAGFEAIDNLEIGYDTTPPTVEIDEPADLDCVCGAVGVQGIVCDFDGAYGEDRLEYRRIWPQTQTEWTLVGDYLGSPVCESDSLYEWDTVTVIDGVYLLRTTATNYCGMSTSVDVTVQVNNAFDALELQRPTEGAVLGGSICIDGTAWDRQCFDHYNVEYLPRGGIHWNPVDPDHDQYENMKTNERLAQWTAASELPDGEYAIRLVGDTDCGTGSAQSSDVITLELDNTPPEAVITEPRPCSRQTGRIEFHGTAHDANLMWWELDYYYPQDERWVHIERGTESVVSGLLGAWHTTGLPPCYYCVRLRVWDEARLNTCDDATHRHSDYFLGIAVGVDECTADLDGDGDVDLVDYSLFALQFAGPGL